MTHLRPGDNFPIQPSSIQFTASVVASDSRSWQAGVESDVGFYCRSSTSALLSSAYMSSCQLFCPFSSAAFMFFVFRTTLWNLCSD